jgi:hypothetical protein
MSKVPAHWEEMKNAVDIRDHHRHPELDSGSSRLDSGSESGMTEGGHTLIIGNGDVLSLDDAYKRVKETGVDGVMFGRGIFGNPWLFNRQIKVERFKTGSRLW